jgi:small basic protein (TIGR04137 family)
VPGGRIFKVSAATAAATGRSLPDVGPDQFPSPTQATSQENSPMTMDKSLRIRKGGTAVRGVLTRAERIAKLKEQERWQEGRSPIGLPKVRVLKLSMKKKKVKEAPEAEAGKKK